jgi:hypothetical protein
MSFFLILRRIIRQASVWFALAALVGLSGCSTLKVAYNNSDDVVYWWLDSYADLQDGQKQFTRDALADLLRWHRQQQLPDYVALLKRIQTMAPNDITPAQVCAVTEDMRTSVVTLLRYVEPANTKLATQLKPEQLRSIRQRFDKTNKTWKEDWLDPSAEDRLQYRNKQAAKRLEDFYGRLDKPQREALNLWLSKSKFDPALSYTERERRQADSMQTFQRMAQEGSPTPQAQNMLRGLTERTFNSPNERYRAYSRELWDQNCEGFAKFHNSTTAAQRQRMVEALRSYENDFKSLMAQK